MGDGERLMDWSEREVEGVLHPPHPPPPPTEKMNKDCKLVGLNRTC